MPEQKMPKRLKTVEKEKGLSPPKAAIKLGSLADVRGEMARLYRLTLKGVLSAEKFTKLIYGLKEIRCALEGEVMTDIQAKLAELSASVGERRGF